MSSMFSRMASVVVVISTGASALCAGQNNVSGDTNSAALKNEAKSAVSRDPKRSVHIAVVQAGENHYAKGNPGPQANFDCLATQAREAAAVQPRPDIICFPEYSISGWPYPDEVNDLAEKVPGDGPWYKRYQSLARKTGVALLCSLVELDGDRRYNTACIIDAQGEFRGKYRKVHATLGEQGWWGWSKGRGFVLVELDGVRYGISICADMSFPETVRCLELMGADVILHQSIGDDMGRIIPTRALDSKLPIVMSLFQGGSYAVNAEGEMLGKLPSEQSGWKIFSVQPFKTRTDTKYVGLRRDIRKGDYNVRSPGAYAILSDPATRPLWTEVFADKQGRRLTRDEIKKRFDGHYDADDPDASNAAK